MSSWTALVVFALVQGLSWYLLRASGTWAVLFGPRLDLAPDAGLDRLASGDRDWIENHSFWELDADVADTIDDTETDFWGTSRSEAG